MVFITKNRATTSTTTTTTGGYNAIPAAAAPVEPSNEESSLLVNHANHHRRRLSRYATPVAWVSFFGALLLLMVLMSDVHTTTLKDSSSSPLSLTNLRTASMVETPLQQQGREQQEEDENNVPLQSPPLVEYDNDPRYVQELYFPQVLDHFRGDFIHQYETTTTTPPAKWQQRYYQTTQYWKGPGYPVFVIVGGEGPLDDGFLYPFVTQHLAKLFHAAVLEPEHRFYGKSTPLPATQVTATELVQYLTVEQAMADAIALTQHVIRNDFQCHQDDKSSRHYCPVITVGGSYPGFLAALLRMVYPQYVDMAYASSGPILLYGQIPDPNIYYDILTDAAEHASPGCKAAVRKTLYQAVDTIQAAPTLAHAAQAVHVCPRLPPQINTTEKLAHALVEIASYKFHDDNEGAYPPGEDTDLYQSCQVFQTSPTPFKDFFLALQSFRDEKGHKQLPSCYDLWAQFPPDDKKLYNAQGDYKFGLTWDFQVCNDVVFILGFSNYSMFPVKEPSYDNLYANCRARFDITPRPWEMTDKWNFRNLTKHSKILFTNGLKDIWSGGGILHNISDTILALTFPNGAHHSDLTHFGPTDRDTEDVRQGQEQVKVILGKWLKEIQ